MTESKNFRSRIATLAIAAVTAFCAAWCAGQVATASAASITMSGSTSVAPLATKLARGYVNTRQGDGTAFRILQGGSDIGINDVARGRVSIGMSSRDPKPADPGGIVFNKIARDAICIVTNRRNPIANMSRNMIQDIFSGRRRSWRQVTGSRASGPIDLVVRTAASGTQDAFQNIFMGQNLRVAGSASTESSNGLQAQAIKSNPNAIGYASFNFTRGLFVVPYKGVPCTLRNAKSGQYRGARNFYFVTRGRPRGERKQFLNWVKGSRAASRIIASNWVPLR